MSAGLDGPILAAETFDKLPQPRHPIAGNTARGCAGQRDGGGSLRKRIEFRPQGRRRFGKQFGKPPADPPRRREGHVGIGTIDNQAVQSQAVEARTINGELRLCHPTRFEHRLRRGGVGLRQQLLHRVPCLRQIAGAQKPIDGGPQRDDGCRRRTAQGDGLAPQRRCLGEIALHGKQHRGGHDGGGHAGRLQRMRLPHSRDAAGDPPLVEVQLATPQQRPRILRVGLERRFDP